MELLSSIFTLSTAQTALELGCVYALVALALFLSYSILNIADLSTDGCFTLGCAVCCQVTLMGHPFLGLSSLKPCFIFIQEKAGAGERLSASQTVFRFCLLGRCFLIS